MSDNFYIDNDKALWYQCDVAPQVECAINEDQHEKGAKLDTGKAPLVWLKYFSRSLGCIADLTRQGAMKYTPGGFLEVPEANERYASAMLRHEFKSQNGQLFVTDDPEWIKNVLEDTAVAWNALAKLEIRLIEMGIEPGQLPKEDDYGSE